MLYKKMLIFILTGFVMQNAIFKDSPTEKLYQNREYDFIRKKLFTEPTQDGFNIWGTMLNYIIAIGTIGLTSLEVGYSIFEGTKEHYIATLLSPVVGYILYKLNEHYVNGPLRYRNGKTRAFEDFVANWEDYEKYTPEEMRDYFETIFKKQDVDLRKAAPEALEDIKKMLDEHQPPKEMIEYINTEYINTNKLVLYILGLSYAWFKIAKGVAKLT